MIGVVIGIALIQLFINLLIFYLAGCTFGRNPVEPLPAFVPVVSFLNAFATENIADRHYTYLCISGIQSDAVA